jgi:hypothetical protein
VALAAFPAAERGQADAVGDPEDERGQTPDPRPDREPPAEGDRYPASGEGSDHRDAPPGHEIPAEPGGEADPGEGREDEGLSPL